MSSRCCCPARTARAARSSPGARWQRLRAIKVEAGGERRPLRVSVGLAAWREDVGGEELLAQTRAAARRRENGLETIET